MFRFAYRLINGFLGRIGFKLDIVADDFDARLISESDVAEFCRRLAKAYEEWAAKQQVFSELKSFDNEKAVRAFYDSYLLSPFRSRFGGSRFNNLLFLHLIAKAVEPELIVDSGTYQGASAWALSTGAPRSRTISFDIDLSRILRREAGVEYVGADWTSYDFGGANPSGALCYFDDHLDQIRRLLEARERGVTYAIFDDDFPVTSFVPMAHGGMALPKIEFSLDPYLSGKEEIAWMENGMRRTWKIDQTYLARGREAIARTERLPNTSLISGIHQTPYRVVALKQA